MTETALDPKAPPATPPPTTPAASKGLLSRAFGIVLSPKATYAAIVARPRVLGAMLLVIFISCAGTFALLSTEVGQNAALDQQIQQRESFGQPPLTDAQYAQMERFLPYFKYIGVASVAFSLVLIFLVCAGLLFAVFNAILGGDATFKQVLALVVHSGFVFSVSTFFSLPLNYARESLTSATNLSVFVPFLEETSFVSRFLGALDLFFIWWILNLAIGLGVLYKRRTGPIGVGLFMVYVVIALVIASVRVMLSGA